MNVKKEKNYFNVFWISQSISMFGSQITVVGLPLTAIYYLNADSSQMGIFQALATLPFFLFSLFAGVWIDRSRKKYLLILCIGLILSLGSIGGIVGAKSLEKQVLDVRLLDQH